MKEQFTAATVAIFVVLPCMTDIFTARAPIPAIGIVRDKQVYAV